MSGGRGAATRTDRRRSPTMVKNSFVQKGGRSPLLLYLEYPKVFCLG